jgi:Short C-terminal domain
VHTLREGGVIGGGFGAKGAVEGMAVASAINALTRRKKISTVLHIETQNNIEGYFHYVLETPQALRIRLSPIFGRLPAIKPTLETANAPPDPVERIRELGEMRSQGLITDDEFSTAKKRLLEGL